MKTHDIYHSCPFFATSFISRFYLSQNIHVICHQDLNIYLESKIAAISSPFGRDFNAWYGHVILATQTPKYAIENTKSQLTLNLV